MTFHLVGEGDRRQTPDGAARALPGEGAGVGGQQRFEVGGEKMMTF